MPQRGPLLLAELVEDVEKQLRGARLHYGHGTDNPRDEAAYLVLRALRLPFEAAADTPVSGTQAARVRKLAERRVRERMPVAYLVREAWLAGCPFYVDPRVIVPRSHIAELLAARLRPWMKAAPRAALDLCTGSGCLAILCARAFPRARVHASDLSAPALAVARRNVDAYRLRSRVRLIRSDLYDALPRGRYDLILTNPPYVTGVAMRALPKEYRREPSLALAGGGDGLDLVRRIIEGARVRLAPGGLLVCEVGANRRALERAYPRLPFLWPQTAAGTGHVFVLPASALRQE